jgi:hypothetical protein
MTKADAEWIARRMAGVSRAQLKAVVAAAQFTCQEDADSVLETLLIRRERLLRAWGLGDLLSVADGG